MKYLREYQRSLSKQRMNDKRYNVSGSTHRNGTVATSRHTWFVVAKSSTEGTIASANQSNHVPQPGRASDAVASGATSGRGRPWTAAAHAHTAHNKANTMKLIDHIQARNRVGNNHSKNIGKVIKARSDPTFDSAYSR